MTAGQGIVIWFLLIIICCIIAILGIVKDSKPLNNKEMEKLAKGRKAHYINKHFGFSNEKFSVNPKYRASIESGGRWDKVEIEYKKIAPLIADLLKTKRHEWNVYVLSDENSGKYIWCHKGDDNSRVRIPHLLMGIAAVKAKENDCNTVIAFHNHPHTQARYWDLLKPSDADIDCFNTEKKVFCGDGLNFISGIVSQGNYSIFGYAFPDSYIPPGCSLKEIEEENNISKKHNAKLRSELRKVKGEVAGKGLFFC